MMDIYLATIIKFAGMFTPIGFADCDGRLLQIQQNVALYSLLGNVYGGDGKTTFALPDLRPTDATGHKVPWHEGQPREIIAIQGLYPPRD